MSFETGISLFFNLELNGKVSEVLTAMPWTTCWTTWYTSPCASPVACARSGVLFHLRVSYGLVAWLMLMWGLLWCGMLRSCILGARFEYFPVSSVFVLNWCLSADATKSSSTWYRGQTGVNEATIRVHPGTPAQCVGSMQFGYLDNEFRLHWLVWELSIEDHVNSHMAIVSWTSGCMATRLTPTATRRLRSVPAGVSTNRML